MIKERLSAHYLLNKGKLIKRGIVLLDEYRKVAGIIDNGGKPVELPAMRYLNGILLPVKDNSRSKLEFLRQDIIKMLDKGDNALMDLMEKLSSSYLVPIHEDELISFVLLKNLDYQTMEVKQPLSIVPVKWLF